jgi:eukaryotic-like serine/threonine-protein kinase
MALTTGDVIDGKYRIVRLIGEGGMGAVYEGENIRIHRTVAIKVLHSGVAENADAVQRFEREAQAAGRIGSEHIVEVLDLGNLPDGDRYMVMEFLDGEALSARIQKKEKLTARELFPIARQILEGLKAAHGAGIIHRDLKPDNVYLLRTRGGQPDFVKLLDFGISKFSALSGESGFSMTRTGAVMGTPYYMSPEQAKGAKGMDHRADLYAVGVIFYEAVTGRVPFNADTFNELLFKIVLETPQPIEQVVTESDPDFNRIIQKAMAREPGLRFQSAQEFQEAIEQWASGAGVPATVAAFKATPQPGNRTAAIPAVAPPGTPIPTGSGGSGTPGTWAQQTGSPPFVETPAAKKSNSGLMVALAAGAVVVLGGGFAAMKMGGSHDAEPAASAAAAPAAPQGPSPEEAKAAAAADAKKIAEAAQKEADDKIRKAEEEAKAAEEKAKKAGNAAELAEAKQARERVNKLRATAVAAKPPAPGAAAPPPAAPPPAAAPQPQSGRKIRTEL